MSSQQLQFMPVILLACDNTVILTQKLASYNQHEDARKTHMSICVYLETFWWKLAKFRPNTENDCPEKNNGDVWHRLGFFIYHVFWT